jgi:hypothetical protein
MHFFIFLGLFVNEVGLIILLINKSSQKVDSNQNKILLLNDSQLLKKGKVKRGESDITPAIGKLGFYCSKAKTNKLPYP